MKKSKIIIISILVFIMTAALTGCKNSVTTGDEVDDDSAKSFIYWCELPSTIASKVQTLEDTPFYQELEKKTGIKITFVHPPLGQAAEQFKLMVASNNMYDLVEYYWFNYPGGPAKAIEDGTILKLNDYIDRYAPNLKKVISESELAEVYRKGSMTDNGDFFAFPSLNTGDCRTFGGLIIRKDWLDELGLEVPETIDEWTLVLRAFKEKKGAEAPLTGLAPYFLVGGNAFNSAYNIGKGLYLDGDMVKFGVLQPEFRAYVQQMRDWYKEGLLDRGFITVDKKIVASNMTTGKSGACIAFIGKEMGSYLEQMKNDPTYDLVAAPYPVKNKGEKSRFVAMEGDVTSTYLAISSSCKDPITATKWIDFWYSQEGYMFLNFGIEGVSYNMVDGKPVYTDLILNNPDGLTISEALGMYTRASAPAPGINQAPEYLEQFYPYPQQKEAMKLWAECTAEARKTELPKSLMYSLEENEECTALETDINTYCEEMVLKFIIGEEPMERFDDFIQQFKTKFNVERYVAVKQAAYDRYRNR